MNERQSDLWSFWQQIGNRPDAIITDITQLGSAIKRQMLRASYSLSFLFSILFVAAIASLIIRNRLLEPKAKWKPFTYAEMESSLENGVPVLMLAGHDSGFLEFPLQVFNDERILRSCSEGNFDMMLLAYKDWNEPEIKNIFNRFGHTKYPMAFYFQPNVKPLRISPYSADAILKDIRHSKAGTASGEKAGK